jgi:hypothetical protein
VIRTIFRKWPYIILLVKSFKSWFSLDMDDVKPDADDAIDDVKPDADDAMMIKPDADDAMDDVKPDKDDVNPTIIFNTSSSYCDIV